MPNRHYQKGRRAEYKARAILETDDYHVFRMAGSHTIFDIIALSKHGKPGEPIVRCIQVKAGRKPSVAEREEIEAAIVPPLASKEIWRFIDRIREPEIEFLK
jgi:Holliday junction resolvase